MGAVPAGGAGESGRGPSTPSSTDTPAPGLSRRPVRPPVEEPPLPRVGGVGVGAVVVGNIRPPGPPRERLRDGCPYDGMLRALGGDAPVTVTGQHRATGPLNGPANARARAVSRRLLRARRTVDDLLHRIRNNVTPAAGSSRPAVTAHRSADERGRASPRRCSRMPRPRLCVPAPCPPLGRAPGTAGLHRDASRAPLERALQWAAGTLSGGSLKAVPPAGSVDRLHVAGIGSYSPVRAGDTSGTAIHHRTGSPGGDRGSSPRPAFEPVRSVGRTPPLSPLPPDVTGGPYRSMWDWSGVSDASLGRL